jgi:hypothetical protein
MLSEPRPTLRLGGPQRGVKERLRGTHQIRGARQPGMRRRPEHPLQRIRFGRRADAQAEAPDALAA